MSLAPAAQLVQPSVSCTCLHARSRAHAVRSADGRARDLLQRPSSDAASQGNLTGRTIPHARMHAYMRESLSSAYPVAADPSTKASTADIPALTVCVRNPKWLSLCGWRRSLQRRPQVQGTSTSTTRTCAPRMRRVDPTDERLDIVILRLASLRA